MPVNKVKQTSRKEDSTTIDPLTIAETATKLRSSTDFVRDEIKKKAAGVPPLRLEVLHHPRGS